MRSRLSQYQGCQRPDFPVGDVDPRLPAHEDVLGLITCDGQAWAFPQSIAVATLPWATHRRDGAPCCWMRRCGPLTPMATIWAPIRPFGLPGRNSTLILCCGMGNKGAFSILS